MATSLRPVTMTEAGSSYHPSQLGQRGLARLSLAIWRGLILPEQISGWFTARLAVLLLANMADAPAPPVGSRRLAQNWASALSDRPTLVIGLAMVVVWVVV